MVDDEVDWVLDTVLGIVGENPCGDGTGRDCQGMIQDEIDWAFTIVEFIRDELAAAIDPCLGTPTSCVPSDPCPEQTVEECFGIPEVNLDPEDLIVDDVYNSLLDEPGDCDVSVAPPVKVQDGATGIWFVTASGEAECPEYDEVEVTTCIQIKTPDGWKRKNCSEGAFTGNYDGATVFAPCYKTHKYRTKFTWQAVVHAGALNGVALEDAPSSGTKKTPLDGVKITCPDP